MKNSKLNWIVGIYWKRSLILLYLYTIYLTNYLRVWLIFYKIFWDLEHFRRTKVYGFEGEKTTAYIQLEWTSNIWVIRTRMGEKLDKCHFSIENLRILRTEKSKNSYYLILAVRVSKIRVSCFRRNLGCAKYVQSWVFFQNFQNTFFVLLYFSAYKKATSLVFIWGDRKKISCHLF